MNAHRDSTATLAVDAAYGDTGIHRRRTVEGESPDDAVLFFLEECLRDHGCARALYVGVDADGGLVGRQSVGFEGVKGRRLAAMTDLDSPLVAAVMEGRATQVTGADLSRSCGFEPDVWRDEPPGAIAIVPLLAMPVLGRGDDELRPRCALYRPDRIRTRPCWLDRSEVLGGTAPPWPERISVYCPDCPVFGVVAVVVLERREPFTDADVERLGWEGRIAGQRVRALDSLDRLERSVDRFREEKDWLGTIMVSAADPIILTDGTGRLILQNRRAEELLVAGPEDSAGKRRAIEINDIMFSSYLSSLGMDPQRAPREVALVSPIDGSDLLFEAISTAAYGSGGQRLGIVTVLRDITDLQKATQELLQQVYKAQRAENAMRQERDRLNMIVQSAVEPIVVSNAENDIVLTNGEGERLFQVGEDDPPLRQRAVRHNDASFSSFLTEFLADTWPQRKREIRLHDPATDEVRSFEVTAGKVHDDRGHTVAVISVFHDLTRLRELERRRIEQRLFESEKLAATGRLAASIAHEMNNPLESIKNSLYILKVQIPEGDPTFQFIQIAQKECDRVGNIIKQFLGIYRPTVTMGPVDVERVLEDELKLLENQLSKHGVEVVRSLGKVPTVVGSEDQLKQVFLNLILNAMEAMSSGGTLTISTRRHETPSATSTIAPSIWVTIADTGPGIPPENMTSIFQPFFTTKSEKGTGLGLWVSYGIIKAHQGDIQVESQPAAGTKFNVIFPCLPNG